MDSIEISDRLEPLITALSGLSGLLEEIARIPVSGEQIGILIDLIVEGMRDLDEDLQTAARQ